MLFPAVPCENWDFPCSDHNPPLTCIAYPCVQFCLWYALQPVLHAPGTVSFVLEQKGRALPLKPTCPPVPCLLARVEHHVPSHGAPTAQLLSVLWVPQLVGELAVEHLLQYVEMVKVWEEDPWTLE